MATWNFTASVKATSCFREICESVAMDLGYSLLKDIQKDMQTPKYYHAMHADCALHHNTQSLLHNKTPILIMHVP